jgi:hypothetical protein
MHNVACCESLSGRTGAAIEHLRRAIDRTDQQRMAIFVAAPF